MQMKTLLLTRKTFFYDQMIKKSETEMKYSRPGSSNLFRPRATEMEYPGVRATL